MNVASMLERDRDFNRPFVLEGRTGLLCHKLVLISALNWRHYSPQIINGLFAVLFSEAETKLTKRQVGDGYSVIKITIEFSVQATNTFCAETTILSFVATFHHGGLPRYKG